MVASKGHSTQTQGGTEGEDKMGPNYMQLSGLFSYEVFERAQKLLSKYLSCPTNKGNSSNTLCLKTISFIILRNNETRATGDGHP